MHVELKLYNSLFIAAVKTCNLEHENDKKKIACQL